MSDGIPTVGTDLAFPCEGPNVPAYGLTKREWFAGLAMQGLCANSIAGSQHHPKFLSKEALEQADALIAALQGLEQT